MIIPRNFSNTDLGFVAINFPAEVSKNAKIVIKRAYNLSSEMLKGKLEHDHYFNNDQ